MTGFNPTNIPFRTANCVECGVHECSICHQCHNQHCDSRNVCTEDRIKTMREWLKESENSFNSAEECHIFGRECLTHHQPVMGKTSLDNRCMVARLRRET